MSQGRAGGTLDGLSAASATCRWWREVSAISLLTAALLFGTVTAAKADEFVVFSDPHMRMAVAGLLGNQGQIPLGSEGTTITASDMQTLTTLCARGQRVVHLDGLQCAVNIASLDLGGNEIDDLTPLGGLTNLMELDVSGNDLDLRDGAPAMSVIATLQCRGTHVLYRGQRARLAHLTASSSVCKYGRPVTFTASLAPRGASSCASKLRLYHLETKAVTRRIKGKKKRVAVNYWRLRRTLPMGVSPTNILSVKGKLAYAGKWRAEVAFAGSDDYVACRSTAITFVVQDPRIQSAIGWAMRRRGSHAWDHYCLRFVGDCYERGAAASVHRYGTAKQAARALHAAAHRNTNAPRGAWVFYDSTPQGHVGISLGDGTMISDYGDAGVKVMRIKSGGHYVGWTAPPLSPPISDWKLAPKS